MSENLIFLSILTTQQISYTKLEISLKKKCPLPVCKKPAFLDLEDL